MKPLLPLILSTLLLGCASGPLAQDAKRPAYPAPSIGPYHNPYAGNPNLAAVSIIDGPSDPFDQFGFLHRQPSQICFAFWDGRVQQVQYRGDGTVWDAYWWPSGARLQPGSVGWAGFDFTYGSDPTFLRHRDPRLRDAPAPAPPGRG